MIATHEKEEQCPFSSGHTTSSAKANKALDAAEKPDEMLDLSYEQMLGQITQVPGPWWTSPPRASRSNSRNDSFNRRSTTSRTRPRRPSPQGKEDLAKEELTRKATAQAQIDRHGAATTSSSPIEETEAGTDAERSAEEVNDFRSQRKC